jgi:hypothetical protein
MGQIGIRADSQARVKTGNTLAADRMGQSLLRWATGDGEC